MSSLADQLGLSEKDVEQTIGANLNNHIIAAFSYGLYSMVFATTLRQIVARGQWPTQRIILTAVVCLIWTLATIYIGRSWNGLYTTYVTHGQSQDSILRYIFAIGDGTWSSKRLALNVVLSTTVVINAMLAELTNIWRCWELYHHSWYVVAPPLLGVIMGLLSHAFALVARYPTGPTEPLSSQQINWTVVYYSVTASINILTTSLIILRILFVSGLKHARTYRGLIEILVESAFMYSATYIIYLTLYVRIASWSYDYIYVDGLLNAVTAAAPTLIIGRVMAGNSRPNDSWTRSSLPHMPTTISGTLRFAGARPSETVGTTSDVESSTPSWLNVANGR